MGEIPESEAVNFHIFVIPLLDKCSYSSYSVMGEKNIKAGPGEFSQLGVISCI